MKVNDLQTLLYASRPQAISNEQIQWLLNSDFLEALLKIKQVKLDVGHEHSKYVNAQIAAAIKSNRPFSELGYIHEDKERFTGSLMVKDYLSTSTTSSYAAGKRINLNLFSSSPLSESFFDIRCFAGLEQSKSAFHFDWNPYPNILINLYGKKKILLVSPEHSKDIKGYFNFATDQHVLSNSLHPQEYVLAPGEALLIPIFWWHEVTSLDTTCSLSFRFKTSGAWNAHLYPSWKVIQSYSQYPKQTLELASEVARFNQVYEKYEYIEKALNEICDFKTEMDHPFYETWSKSYIFHNLRNRQK